MKLYRVYPASTESHLCTTYADSADEAVEAIRQVHWLAVVMEDSAWAEEVREEDEI